MEVKRYPSIYFLVREMRKDLFGVDTNNSVNELSLLVLQSTNFDFSSTCKKNDINKWKKVN